MTAESFYDNNLEHILKKALTCFESHIIKLMQDFAELKCKEQREICAKEYDKNYLRRDLILNSPLPKF